ncbi:trypsin-like peptidase domain-containing protein [Halobacillus litoralis]|uniref:trypsin-like peptidase domain-containing protein n=1 Tax=Halobacillus litoralis TaxID=45668 RepID=UPI001CFD3430|nr:trypsin-like peptidase domain-containing protein [Halobacillus litoralis]
MLCPKCQTRNDVRGAKYCLQCGYSLTRSRNKSMWWVVAVVAACCMVWTGGVLAYLQWQGAQVKQVAREEAAEVVAPALEEKTEKSALDSEGKPDNPEVEKEEPPAAKSQEDKDKQPPADKDKKEIIRDVQSRVYTILTNEVQGSGFLYSKDGTIVTNAHVVAGYTEVMVRDSNNQEYTGQVIGISDQFDIALLQVDELNGRAPLQMEMEPSKLGAEVIALGSPRGLENTASIGYVTGVGRSFESDFQYENVYQIDAQVSPGSSGGPLVDAETGRVIGINSAILNADESIAFSIPLYTMEPLLSDWSKSPMTAGEVMKVFSFYETAVTEQYEEEAYQEESPEEQEAVSSLFDPATLTDFILAFRDQYETALNNEDFAMIEGMLLYDSPAYVDYSSYLTEIAGQGMVFEFTSNEVTDMNIQKDSAVVRTYEVFDFMNASGDWSVYERVKDYTVVIDEYDSYKITEIDIYD